MNRDLSVLQLHCSENFVDLDWTLPFWVLHMCAAQQELFWSQEAVKYGHKL